MTDDSTCIHHRVEFDATPAEVYRALTEAKGLSGWWTEQVEAQPEVGSIAKFFFGGGAHVALMRIEALEADSRVVWRCEDGPWKGHQLTFAVAATDRGSVLAFAHAGWPGVDDFYGHCSAKWGFFLTASLKPLLEMGRGVPHPHEPRI